MMRAHLAGALTACLFAGTALAQQQQYGSPPSEPSQQPQFGSQPSQPSQPSQQQQLGTQGAQGAQGMQAGQAAPMRGAAQMISATATVEKIDKSKHEVTLKTPEGNHVMVQIPENVHNLDNVKVGDRLTVDYYQALAMTLKKHEGAVGASARTFQARPSSNMPGGMEGQEINAVAKVTKVDADKGMISIEGPQGKQDTINVQDPQMKQDLKQIKPGDAIDVTYTQALAVTVNKKS